MIHEQMWVPVEEYTRVRALVLNIIQADGEHEGPAGAIDYARTEVDNAAPPLDKLLEIETKIRATRPKFSEIMEAREDHKCHGPQWQVGWLGASGTWYPITTPWDTIKQYEPASTYPVYMDAGD